MLGHVRKLPQTSGQSQVVYAKQIIEQHALRVRDVVPAKKLRLHNSLGKRHVAVAGPNCWDSSNKNCSSPVRGLVRVGTVAAALAVTGPRPLSSAGLEGWGGYRNGQGQQLFSSAFSFFFLLFFLKMKPEVELKSRYKKWVGFVKWIRTPE